GRPPMPGRLKITMDEDLYRRLKREVPPKRISLFISQAVRRRLLPDRRPLDAAYKAARRERWRRRVAEDWRAAEPEQWQERRQDRAAEMSTEWPWVPLWAARLG